MMPLPMNIAIPAPPFSRTNLIRQMLMNWPHSRRKSATPGRTKRRRLFAKLKTDKFLQGLSVKDFAKQAAHFLAELNAIHAFRDGNGRAQLSFFLLLAQQAGHPLDFGNFDPPVFLQPMIASFGGDEASLANLVEGLVKE
jgi:hypothetical protein